ncbi:MAG: alpha/beta hydrolase [Gracilimonas sp.]|nr:alpha/beta hydrolase [Gracilimonas sp.]
MKVLRAPDYSPDDINLNYKVVDNGAGSNLLLLHGLAGTLDYWERGVQEASEMHNLYMIDLLGFGDSPKTKSEYSLAEHLSAIEKIVIKEQLNDGRTRVVGHSMGALLALALVSKNPGWYGGLVLISLPVFSGRADMKNQYKKSGTLFEKISVSGFGKYFCMIHPVYYIEMFRPDNIPKDIFFDSKKHTWLSYDRSLDNIVLNADITNNSKTLLRNKKIFFVHGDKDITAPYERAVKFAQHFGNRSFMTIDKGDHQIYLTNHDAIWQNFHTFFYE